MIKKRMLCGISGHTRQDRSRNEYIGENVVVAPIVQIMVESHLKCFQHVWRPVETKVVDIMPDVKGD